MEVPLTVETKYMWSLWCKIKQNSPWNIHQGLYHYHLEFLILEQFDQVQRLGRLCNTSPHPADRSNRVSVKRICRQ